MAEEDKSNAASYYLETEDDLAATDSHDFCLLSQDEIEEESCIPSSSAGGIERTNRTESTIEIVSKASTSTNSVSPVDVEAIKRKAEVTNHQFRTLSQNKEI